MHVNNVQPDTMTNASVYQLMPRLPVCFDNMLIYIKFYRMIETQQWRITIGAFAGGRSLPPTSRNTTSGINTSTTMISPRSLYGVATERLCLYCYIIIIVCMLLLRSGNVELNPGREPPKSCSIPLTTVTSNIVTDNDNVPVVQSLPEFVSSNGVVNTDSESPIPKLKPVIEKMSTSQKWEKYKININKRRRRSKYRCNPSSIKAKRREAYKSNPLPVRERVKQAYKLNPSPVKESIQV